METFIVNAKDCMAFINTKNIRCIMHYKQNQTLKVIYDDNTNSTFKDVEDISFAQLPKT